MLPREPYLGKESSMRPFSVRYRFAQRFDVPAFDAYSWATRYDPLDIALMGKKGKRKTVHVSEDAVVLTDTIVLGDGSSVTKRKLVRLNPERLSWTSTHLTGPNKHSQFLYEIVPDGERSSRLEFTGLHLDYEHEAPTSRKRLDALARAMAKEDAATWKILARAMAAELRPPKVGRAS